MTYLMSIETLRLHIHVAIIETFKINWNAVAVQTQTWLYYPWILYRLGVNLAICIKCASINGDIRRLLPFKDRSRPQCRYYRLVLCGRQGKALGLRAPWRLAWLLPRTLTPLTAQELF
jgi:hypothetical protein